MGCGCSKKRNTERFQTLSLDQPASHLDSGVVGVTVDKTPSDSRNGSGVDEHVIFDTSIDVVVGDAGQEEDDAPVDTQAPEDEAGGGEDDAVNGVYPYPDDLKCIACMSEHMSKASVELKSYVDDSTKLQMFSLSIGDLGCAADMAAALGLSTLAIDIRLVRRTAYSMPETALRRLLALSEKCGQMAIESEYSEMVSSSY